MDLFILAILHILAILLQTPTPAAPEGSLYPGHPDNPGHPASDTYTNRAENPSLSWPSCTSWPSCFRHVRAAILLLIPLLPEEAFEFQPISAKIDEEPDFQVIGTDIVFRLDEMHVFECG